MITNVNSVLFTFVVNRNTMEITDWYRNNFEKAIAGRYINLERITPLLQKYSSAMEITYTGKSEDGRKIPVIKLGDGKETILAWSQMHGNESTTTKALFDLLKFFDQKSSFDEQKRKFLKEYTLYIIPILNPDGAGLYTRENANGIDLNRDFEDLSQKESQFLRLIFDEIKPCLCLNMHDQRSIYGVNDGNSATISFLAPSADALRSLTPARKKAMEGIVKMYDFLKSIIPGHIGRYDDSYNGQCAGDAFQAMDTPTILFEAGQYLQDYNREKTREFIFYALLSLFDIIPSDSQTHGHENYFKIPENQKNFRDIIVRNVLLKEFDHPVDVAIHYREVLLAGSVVFEPMIDQIGKLSDLFGIRELEGRFTKTLTNEGVDLTVGSKVSKIVGKNEISIPFFR